MVALAAILIKHEASRRLLGVLFMVDTCSQPSNACDYFKSKFIRKQELLCHHPGEKELLRLPLNSLESLNRTSSHSLNIL